MANKQIAKPVLKKETAQVKKATPKTVVANPNQPPSYTWQAEDKIPITGIDFQEVYNGMKAIYEAESNTSPEKKLSYFQQSIITHSIMQALERTFQNAVKADIIKQS